MVSRKFGAITKRILAAIVMIPIALEALYLGSPFIETLAVVVGGLLAWEWASMLSKPETASYYVTAYMISLAVSIWNSDLAMPMITIVSFFVWFIAYDEKYRKLLTLGVSYISIGISSLVWMYLLFDPSEGSFDPRYNYSFMMVMWFFLTVWSMDIGGLVVGCNLRGPKLAPTISPNKTWSGLIGGVLLAVSVSIIFMYICVEMMDMPFYDFSKFRYISFSYKPLDFHHEWTVNSQLFYAICAAIIAVLAQIGDLIESVFKRSCGVKDSGKLIPGRGGVLDSIDSIVIAAPIFYIGYNFLF